MLFFLTSVNQVLVAYRLETSQFKTEKDLSKIKELFPDSDHIVLGSNKEQPAVRYHSILSPQYMHI